jgi:hypothetical protein
MESLKTLPNLEHLKFNKVYLNNKFFDELSYLLVSSYCKIKVLDLSFNIINLK